MTSDIILIGPPMAGKSTLAVLLSEALKVPKYSLDELRWSFMKEIGYDEELDLDSQLSCENQTPAIKFLKARSRSAYRNWKSCSCKYVELTLWPSKTSMEASPTKIRMAKDGKGIKDGRFMTLPSVLANSLLVTGLGLTRLTGPEIS